MRLLAIESSCDDTAAAVFVDGTLRASVVASQDAVHAEYGGVVPELASRSHMRAIVPVVRRALAEAELAPPDIDAIAATRGPGLIGSLLVGLSAGKALARSLDRPFVGVHHVEGHLLSVLLEHEIEFPYLGLVASGGHTSLVLVERPGRYRTLGVTRDDAAGEAFDKVAKLLGLGYPGGRVIDELARQGDPRAIAFPRARLKSRTAERNYDFSFSGIKTAVGLHVREHGASPAAHPDIAASFQEAVVDMLLETTLAAARDTGVRRIVLVGGVSANSRLRSRAMAMAELDNLEVIIPSPRFCTDNAAMIGAVALRRLERGLTDPLTVNAAATLPIESWQ